MRSRSLDRVGGAVRGRTLAVDHGRAVAGRRPDDRFLGRAAALDDPRAGVGPLVQQEDVAGRRGGMSRRQAAIRVCRGSAAASRARHDVSASSRRRESRLGASLCPQHADWYLPCRVYRFRLGSTSVSLNS